MVTGNMQMGITNVVALPVTGLFLIRVQKCSNTLLLINNELEG